MKLSVLYSGWRADFNRKWRLRLLSLHDAHFSIVRGMAWTLTFVVIARCIGAGREVAIAAHFGAGRIVDAYLFVFSLLSWPVAVWFSVLSVVLVPTVMRLHKDECTAELKVFHAGLLGITLLLGCVVGLLFWLLLGSGLVPPFVGFPHSTAKIARSMTTWLTPIVPLGFLASFYSAWVMATGRYINTLIEAFPALAILIAVLAFSDGNAKPLLWGTLIGFLMQVIVLAVLLNWWGELAKPRLFLRGGTHWREFWLSFGIMGIGQVLMTASGIVDQFMAAPLEPGTIATLGYANRIVALLLALGALSVSRATLPTFSAMRAAGDPRLPRVAIQWSGALFFGGIVVSVLAWICAPTIIRLLYQRGAFTVADTRGVVSVFSFALVQIPFYFGGLVLTAQLAASNCYRFITVIGVVILIAKPILNWLLIPTLGPSGIMLATGMMYALSFAMMVAYVVMQGKRAEYKIGA